MYYITINVQYVRYSTGRKIKYFIVYRLSFIGIAAGCQATRQAAIEMACIEADMFSYIGRLVGKELGKEAGRTENCQATRKAGIEAGVHTDRNV
jgi:hypothetical protein